MTFPEFTPLTLEDRDIYGDMVKGFPPISDISFSTLMVWWNFKNNVSISKLNNNVLINYELPGDEENSGLGFVGVDNVDVSLNTVFNELRRQGRPQKLVHVPQFVVEHIEMPEDFDIKDERDYDEYIVPTAQLYPLENMNHNMRRKIKKFLIAVEGKAVEIRSLDLSFEENRRILLDKADEWQKAFSHNDRYGNESIAMRISIEQSEKLQMKNLCLFIDNVLHGFIMYQISHDDQYAIINHLKVDYTYARVFDYLTYEGVGEVVRQGIPYLNLEMDLGIPGLRVHKMELKPTDFFRKYTITPCGK